MTLLKKLRKDRGLLQKQVAEKIGVGRTTYVKYENGDSEPDYKTLIKIADFYKVSIDELLGRGETKKEPAVDAFADDKLSLEIMELFAKLSETEKQIVLAQIKGITSDRK